MARWVAQHPYSGVEPLKGSKDFHQDDIDAVMTADVSQFVHENNPITLPF